MSKRKKRQRDRRIASRHSSSTHPSQAGKTGYEVSWEPLLNIPYNALPPGLDREMERLHSLVLTDPAKAIVELETWIERYPGDAKLYNFLSSAYLSVGDKVNSERITRENYRRHPDYLFAKLNVAELCLQGGNLDEIPSIFHHKYDLSLIYPERKRFHITEFTSFMGIMGWYFCMKKERERARVYYEALLAIAPDHSATKDLCRRLRILRLSEKIKNVLRRILPSRRK